MTATDISSATAAPAAPDPACLQGSKVTCTIGCNTQNNAIAFPCCKYYMHIPCVNKCLEYLRKTAIKYSKLFRPLCPHYKRDWIHWKDWYRFITCTPKSYDFPGLVYIPVHTYIMQYIPGTYIPDPTRAKQWLVGYLDITESYDGWLVGYMKITITDKKCRVSGYAPSLWRETIPLVQIRRCDSRFNNLNFFEILVESAGFLVNRFPFNDRSFPRS